MGKGTIQKGTIKKGMLIPLRAPPLDAHDCPDALAFCAWFAQGSLRKSGGQELTR